MKNVENLEFTMDIAISNPKLQKVYPFFWLSLVAIFNHHNSLMDIKIEMMSSVQ